MPTKNSRKALGYARVSTQEQALACASMDAQEFCIQSHCAANGLELVGIHRDPGKSARTLDRAGM